MHNPARVALIGAAVAALLTLPGLGSGTLWDNSETAYGEVAREVLLYHDAVVMHFNGGPWFVQPPLYFWLAAVFAKIFGVGAFAMRLPSAIATILMGALTGYAVARAAGARAGLYASIVLSTSLMQAIMGRLAIMDALLDLTVAAAVLWWWQALQTGRNRYLYLGAAAAALGTLAKGPVALVICLLVIVPYYYWNRRNEETKAPGIGPLALAAVLFAVIALPWMVLLAQRTGSGSIVQLIGHYTIGRYTSTIENQAGPFWYYLPVLIVALFPWFAFLPAAMAYGINQVRGRGPDDGQRALLRLALVWIVLPFVFFSAARTKLPNYIALELPGLAILIALYFDSIVLRFRRRSLIVSSLAIPVTIGLLAIAISVFSHQNKLPANATDISFDLLVAGAAIFVGSAVTTYLFLSERTAGYAPYVLGASSFAAIIVLAAVALPLAERYKPIPRFAALIQAQRLTGDAVTIQGVPGGNALIFYSRPPVQTLAVPGAPNPLNLPSARSVICAVPRAFLITSRDVPPAFGRTRRLLAADGKATLYLYEGPACSP